MRSERQWLGRTFNERNISFPDHTTWRLGQKISETFQQDDVLCEARAVFLCKAMSGPYARSEAVVKIRMQIPIDYDPSPDSRERGKEASDEMSYWTRQEIEALKCLTEAQCSSSPELLSWKQENQDEFMWVPGGYVVYILMEKLSGETLDNFWDEQLFDAEHRNLVRKAFREAFCEVNRCGVFPRDYKRDNLIWDKSRKKCYVIDFEDAVWKSDFEWNEAYYYIWGLAQELGRDKEKW